MNEKREFIVPTASSFASIKNTGPLTDSQPLSLTGSLKPADFKSAKAPINALQKDLV
jgi:hypothetical protein